VKTILVVPDDLTSGSFATISPDGKFPVFQDGVHKLSGSTDAILEYMEKTFTDSPLVPSEMVKEADEWVAYIRDNFTPLIRQLLYDGNPLIQQDLETKLHDAFAKLDGGIGLNRSKGPFFLGSQFTLVDVYVIPFLALVDVITYFRGLEIASTYPHLVAYKAAVSTFPSYKPVQVDIDLLKKAVAESWVQKAPLPIVLMTILQHHSILVHLERFVRLVDRLASVKPEDIAKDSMKRTLIGTQLRGLPKQFGQLLDLMQEHAQMEERIIFPALDMADPGLSASALKDHARDLPVMNGIREDIKGIMALKQGSSDHVEALSEVVIRLHTLQVQNLQHSITCRT
jgi:glutathione S-transferase/iron-sulfur cluster repair protein YtfE (RIC family)